jgi:hypothetical protein
MAEKLKIRKTKTGKIYVFWCEGCQQTHSYDVREDGGEPTWEFNGDMEKPSFNPSLQYGRCHLFLKDGIIEYCRDCYHHLSGQKVPLVEF